jgi:hypothetical protein
MAFDLMYTRLQTGVILILSHACMNAFYFMH